MSKVAELPEVPNESGAVLPRQSTGVPPGHVRNTVLMVCAIVAVMTVLPAQLLQPHGWGDARGWSPMLTFTMVSICVVGGLWLCLLVVFRPKVAHGKVRYGPNPPYRADEYTALGLGPVSDDDNGARLYIDLMKRCVANILYEDRPIFFYNGRDKPQLALEFDLLKRVMGEDGPTQAHTMIGIKRLDNIQHCVEEVLGQGVPGDFAETGSYRGGATIFMRAVLKAHRITDRKVFLCDAFVPPQPNLPPWPLMPLVQALASVPGRANKRRMYCFLERMPQKHRAFPICENPGDDWIEFVLWLLRHPETINCGDVTSRAHVESRFARYGLLDDQVVIVEGYFKDILPDAPIDKLALLRLDGDTYESTRDAIEQLYPKLSPGGYCIVDDFHAFEDCARAVNEYRQQHNIQESIQPIDDIAVFWQKH